MSLTRMLAGASLAVVWASVFAQASTPRPDPLDPNAPTTTLTVPRTFEEYIPYKDPKVVPWKDTNAAVSGDGMAGMAHGAAGGMKHDMGTMKMPGASSPAAPMPGHTMPMGPVDKSLPEGGPSPAPGGNADHSNHKM
ncbi:hypothetical protein [Cupriavidus sp. 8B]